MKTPRTLSEIESDPRVESISDERSNGDGIWVWLIPKYADYAFDPFQPTRQIHEWTVSDVCNRFNSINQI